MLERAHDSSLAPLGSRASQLEELALLKQMLAVCPASSPARRACIDACGLAPGVTEQRARRLEIFRMLFEIRCCPEMPKLMRRHGNADMPHDGIGDLSS